MKAFTTILLLAAFSLVKSTSPAADVVQKAPSPLELVLIDDHVVFSTATTVSMEMIFRNVGEEKMKPYDLLLGLSAKLEALKASCQKKGVDFIESAVN